MARVLILPSRGLFAPPDAALPVGLLPLLGCPILDLLLSQLRRCGDFDKITFFFCEHPERLEEACFLAKIEPVPVRRGLDERAILKKAGLSQTTLVLREGTLVGIDYARALRLHREGPHPLTVILTPGGLPAAYLLEPEVLDPREVPCQTIRAGGYGDASIPLGYHALHRELLLGRLGLPVPGEEIRPGIWIEAGAKVHPRSELNGLCWIGSKCRVERECSLRDSFVEGEARLQRGATLQGSVVLGRTRVGKATRWNEQVLFHSYAVGKSSEERAEAEVLAEWGGRKNCSFSLDALFAAVLLILIAPLLVLIALSIVLDSPGPVFYSQLRVGQKKRKEDRAGQQGKVFDLYKFRTMRLDADREQTAPSSGIFNKPENDPRITRVGSFLRRTSLDELPQLVNVLKGDIRLVGNRPLPVYEAERLREAWQLIRFQAPAGITGLWQISGRSELSDVERLALDAYYAVNRTFLGDLCILLRTIPVLFNHRGAR